MKIGVFVISALFFPCALPGQESVVFPAPESLIARAIAADEAQTQRNWKYTYREDHTQSQAGKDGKPGPSEIPAYDHIMLEGADYRKLVLIDGKPLDAKTQKKVDAELEKARAGPPLFAPHGPFLRKSRHPRLAPAPLQ